jgi:hypothetical protein
MQAAKQFASFIAMGSIAILWLDIQGHYRQRLSFWEIVRHILSVMVIGFLLCEFIQFAAKPVLIR